jgi:hypothetical protein
MKVIRDSNGKIIGREDGSLLRDAQSKIVSRYDKQNDLTRDANSKRIGSGDQRLRKLP